MIIEDYVIYRIDPENGPGFDALIAPMIEAAVMRQVWNEADARADREKETPEAKEAPRAQGKRAEPDAERNARLRMRLGVNT